MPEKNKHTPGPWTFETVQTSSGLCHKVGPFPFSKGEDNHACVYVDSNYWSAADELKANAQLISAAPDLLAALEEAEKWMQGKESKYDLDVALHFVAAAIYKARGVI